MINALSGYMVLDLTDEKGMPCGRLLAGMGAKVVRPEEPGRTARSPDSWSVYNNAGKSRITLDLSLPEGRSLFTLLVSKADILVESRAPGYLDAIGLGYETLRQAAPALIMASISDFGQSGPYRDRKSCNLVTSALGGHVYPSGAPGTPPIKPAGQQAYNAACLFAAIGIMLAMRRRHETGRGQYLDVSALECAAATLDHVLVRYRHQGAVSARQGNFNWNGAFGSFPCRDGYILLSLFYNWETLVELLCAEGLAADLADPKWLNPEARVAGVGHIAEVLERWTRNHAVSELAELGQLMHFPWAPVNSLEQVLSSQQLAARHFFTTVSAADSETRVIPGSPISLPEPSPALRLHSPGEDNLRVYQDLLGLAEAEIRSLEQEGII